MIYLEQVIPFLSSQFQVVVKLTKVILNSPPPTSCISADIGIKGKILHFVYRVLPCTNSEGKTDKISQI